MAKESNGKAIHKLDEVLYIETQTLNSLTRILLKWSYSLKQ